MSDVLWQAGWTAMFAWLTYTTGQSVVLRAPSLEGRIKKFHDYLLRPFGAALTFVLAVLTVGSFIGLIQLALR